MNSNIAYMNSDNVVLTFQHLCGVPWYQAMPENITSLYCRLHCYECVCMYGLCHHYSCTVHCSIAFQKPMYIALSACVTVGGFNASSVYLDRLRGERSLNKRAHIVYTFFDKRQLFLRGLYCQFPYTFCELLTTLLLELPCPFTAAICVWATVSTHEQSC